MRKILVTGASGFLGGAVVAAYAARSSYQVKATSRRNVSGRPNVIYEQGDLCDESFCETLTRDVDFVVHCAALSSPWGDLEEFERANITATRNLLDAAVGNGVKRFIFISTPSIYFDYTDRYDIRESDPLPKRMVNWYALTKLKAEQYVLNKNGSGIEALALRPRAIIGAGDTTIFPRLLKAHMAKKLRVIGKGDVSCDLTCVSNVIHAIDKSLSAGSDALGRAYNITDGRPVKLWPMVNYVLSELGYGTIEKNVPFAVVSGYAAAMEWKYKMFHNGSEPPLTKFGIGVLGKSMTMNIDLAAQLLDYNPIQSTQEGADEFIAWYKKQGL